MTTRDWWIGVGILSSVIGFHAVFPRYDWRDPGGDSATYLRIDRWTGRAELGQFFNRDAGHTTGLWLPITDVQLLRRNRQSNPSTTEVPQEKSLLKEAEKLLEEEPEPRK